MHFKNKNISVGFTFIEVMASLMLIALIITPLMFQQSSIVNSVSKTSRSLDRMFMMQSYLYEVRKTLQEYTTSFHTQKKIEEKDISLTFSRGPVPKKSAFARDNIYQDQVTLSWKDDRNQTEQETLVAFVYVRPEQKEGA